MSCPQETQVSGVWPPGWPSPRGPVPVFQKWCSLRWWKAKPTVMALPGGSQTFREEALWTRPQWEASLRKQRPSRKEPCWVKPWGGEGHRCGENTGSPSPLVLYAPYENPTGCLVPGSSLGGGLGEKCERQTCRGSCGILCLH